MKIKTRVFLLILLLSGLLPLCACQTSEKPAPSPSPITPPSPTVSANPAPSPDLSSSPLPDITETPVPETSHPAEPTPSPEPAPSPDPTPSPGIQKEQLDAYFHSAVFVGDSIMEGIHQYVAKNRSAEPTLGNAQFLTSTMGVSVTRLLDEEQYGPYFRYKGASQPLLQILEHMDCSRIFLLLGLNDLGRGEYDIQRIIADYSLLIDTLQISAPNAEVIVIACPPKVASAWLPDYIPNRNYSNPLILEFVDALRSMCEARGTAFIDIHSLLKNEQGVLPDEYCRDGFVHLNNAGSKLVVEELYRFAAQRLAEEAP